VNAGDLVRLKAQALFVQWGEPVRDGVQGHGSGQDIVNEQTEGAFNLQFDSLVLRNIGGDEFADPEFFQKVLDDGMGAQDELAK